MNNDIIALGLYITIALVTIAIGTEVVISYLISNRKIKFDSYIKITNIAFRTYLFSVLGFFLLVLVYNIFLQGK